MSSTRRFGRSVRSVALVAVGSLALSVVPATSASADHGTPFDLLAACEFAADNTFSDTDSARLEAVKDCLQGWQDSNGTPILQGSGGAANLDATITRAQFSAVLIRIAGILGVTIPDAPSEATFPDVPTTNVFFGNIEQAVELGLFLGTSKKDVDDLDNDGDVDENLFDPIGDISFGQAVSTLRRLLGDALGQTLDDDGNGNTSGLSCGVFQGDLEILEGRSLFSEGVSTLPAECLAPATRGSLFDAVASVMTYEVAIGVATTPHLPPGPAVDATTLAYIDLSDTGANPVRTYNFFNLDPEREYDIALFPCYDDGVEILVDGAPYVGTDGMIASGSVWAFYDENYNSEADNYGTTYNGDAEIKTVFFEDVSTTDDYNFSPNDDGELLVRVGLDDDTDTTDCAIPVIWSDNDDVDGADDDTLDLDMDAVDTFGVPVDDHVVVGGPTVWHSGEAPNGDTIGETVLFVNTTDNFFIDDSDGYMYYYGRDGDLYEYDGSDVDASLSLALFEQYLSPYDYVQTDGESATLPYSDAGSTMFQFNGEYAEPFGMVNVTEDDHDGEDDGADLEFTWSGPATSMLWGNADQLCVRIHDEDYVYVTEFCSDETDTLASTPETTFITEEHILADGDYVATFYFDSEDNDSNGYGLLGDMFTIGLPAETVAPTIDDLTVTEVGVTPGILDATDVIHFAFSEEMDATLGADNLTFFRLSDSDSVYQFDCGTEGCVLDALEDDGADTNGDAADHLAVTLATTGTLISGTANGLDMAGDTVTLTLVSNTFDDVAGNQLDLSGSADLIVDDES